MSDHFIIMADRGHVRVYRKDQPLGQTTPTLVRVQALDFPSARRSYTDRDTDMAGRFQSSNNPSRAPGLPMARTGMSIDERLPMQEEEQRRQAKDLVETIETFLQQHSGGTWDFAAGPEVHNAVLEALSPAARSRLRRALSKNLVNQPVEELLKQFQL
ncbi:MAG TPA: host attachment protein [Opitutus sp.]|nr:host attachment protein [Opitutus sp.]